MTAIKENSEEMRRLEESALWIGVFFLMLNIYWYCYEFFEGWFSSQYSDYILVKINKGLHFFASPYVLIGIAILCIGYFCITEKGRKNGENTYKLFNKKVKFAITKKKGYYIVSFGMFLMLLSPIALFIPLAWLKLIIYALLLSVAVLAMITGSHMVHRFFDDGSERDYFNDIQQSTFPQEERKIENEYSINLPTTYKFGKEVRHGWINVVNPFRGNLVMGTPGSGKSFTFVNEFIRQHLRKGFAMYVYDYKFPDLTKIVYNYYLINKKNTDIYPVQPRFCIVNFEDPRYSHRCNPLNAKFLSSYMDSKESAETILFNINRTWATKQGDFFIDSAKSITATCLEYLRIVEGGKFCTLPHLIELINRNAADLLPVLASYRDLRLYIQSFMDTLSRGVFEQLQGQMSSAQVALTMLSDKTLYWILTGDDFTLDINNPEEPKVFCAGNSPERESVYGAALSLINGRIVKSINKPKQLKMSFIVDELPTIYFRGIDRLIGTARSNKVCVCLGYQDNSQLIADYGDKEAAKIINTPGNFFCGQVKGDTAKKLQELFGKNIQKTKSINTNDEGVSINVSEKTDYMIPAEKIAQLSQGSFAGIVADDVQTGCILPVKVFHANVDIDIQTIKEDEKKFKPLPQIYDFDDMGVLIKIQSMIESMDSDSLVKELIIDAKIRNMNAEKYSPKEISIAIKQLKNILQAAKSKKWLQKIEDIEKKRMEEVLDVNYYRIKDDVDNLLKREIEKINTDEQYEELRAIRDAIIKQ